MRMQILSDLHLENEDFTIPETDADLLVLAGDIHECARDMIPWIKAQTDKPVIFIAGNHDYYGELCPELKYKLEKACHSNFNYTRVIKDEKTGKELISGAQQINFLEKSEVILTDKYRVTGKIMVSDHEFDDFETTNIRFLGCTLWTENMSPWIRYRNIRTLKNYKQLETSAYENFRLQLSEFSPSDAKQIFEESVGWLDYKLKQTPDIPTVVVTHHAPSYRSNIMANGDKYISDFDPDLQSAYMNNLDEFILEHQSNLKLWIHGHLHSSSDYMIGDTRIICNPRGRGSAEEKNPDFDPKLIVEVEGR